MKTRIFNSHLLITLAVVLASLQVSAQYWQTTGNLTNGASFIGTLSDQPLHFRVNAAGAGRIEWNGSVFLGLQSGSGSITLNNVGIGRNTLVNNTGDYNSAVGVEALQNTSGAYNAAIGYQAMNWGSCKYSCAMGSGALQGINFNSGNYNTALGYQSMMFNSTGAFNSGVGSNSLKNNTTGSSNTAVGYNSMVLNQTGIHNAALGQFSLANNTGSYNSVLGSRALFNGTSGSNNTALGYQAMQYNATGNSNTALGSNAGPITGSLNNITVLGANSTATVSDKVRVGDVNVTSIEGQVSFSTPSDGRFKNNVREEVHGLDFVTRLRPVVYNFDTRKFDEFLLQNAPDSMKSARLQATDYSTSTEIRRTGFIAQEVELAAKEVGYQFSGLHAPSTDSDNYSISYSEFVMPLVKAVQELHAANTALEQRLDAQAQMIEELKQALGDRSSSTKPNLNGVELGQNAPNPCDGSTQISFSLPSSRPSSNITLMVRDASGKLVKTIAVQGEKGSVTLDTQALSQGVYSYSLVIDGQTAATKQLVVVKD